LTTFEYAMARVKPAAAHAGVAVRVSWRRVRGHVLAVGGFACLTGAAFTYELWAGLVASGVSLLVLEQRNKAGD
jgi:hypothetical protein